MTIQTSQTNDTAHTSGQGDGRGVLRYVDPATLVIGANVRLDAATDKGLVQSVRDLGVLEPIVAEQSTDDTGETVLTVRYGQRRTLAAVQAKQATVPVLVLDAASVGEAGEARRIVEQLAENDHRAAITDHDRRVAYEQLAGFGMSAAQVAKATGRTRTEVQHAAAVNGSEMASKAAQRWDFLSLSDAALIAEFEDDPRDVEQILKAAKRGESTEHVAQRIRDDRASAAAKAAATAALIEAGLTVIDRPGYDEKKITQLRWVRAHADATEALTEQQHAACPGHAAFLDRIYSTSTSTNPNTDEETGEETVQVGWGPVYVCTDPTINGHTKHDLYGSSSSGRAAGPMSEQEKAERRTVIKNNKAWDAVLLTALRNPP